MTEPKHCEHECFYKKKILNQSCAIPRCQHDTRTHPSTPICDRCKTDQEPFCIGCERIRSHDIDTATRAREEALSILEEWDYHNNRSFGKPHPVFFDMIRMVRENPEEIRKHVISLREKTK